MLNYKRIMTTRDSIDERMKELYGTGVPVPFECKYACKVNVSDCARIEKALNMAFALGSKAIYVIIPSFRLEYNQNLANKFHKLPKQIHSTHET
jgi:hypothetical protein